MSTTVIVRYGIGQLGAQIFRDTPAALLPLFMTTMLGIPPWLAGLVVLIPKLWLIVCDPLTGAVSDRLKPRIGRAPVLLVGGVLTSASFVLLFTLTEGFSPHLAAALTCGVFFLGSTAFSMFSVPYLAVAAELSDDPYQRTRVMMVRMIFTTLGVLVGVGLAQPLIVGFGGGAHGWRVMAVALGLVCLVTMSATALGLMRVPLLAGSAVRGSILTQLAPIARNRPYLVLLSASFVQAIGQASGYTVIGFIYFTVLKAVWIVPLFILVMAISGIATQPMWLLLSRRYGKPRCYVAGSAVWALVTATWLFIHPADDVLVTLPGIGALGTQHVLVLARAAVIGVVNSGFVMLALSMLTDTMEYERKREDGATDGVLAGLYSAAEKLAFALGPVIAGLVLSAYGFVASTGGAVAQSPQAIHGIVLLYSVVPVSTQVVSLMIFSRYRLPEMPAGPLR